jgi:hypothetical protein
MRHQVPEPGIRGPLQPCLAAGRQRVPVSSHLPPLHNYAVITRYHRGFWAARGGLQVRVRGAYSLSDGAPAGLVWHAA